MTGLGVQGCYRAEAADVLLLCKNAGLVAGVLCEVGLRNGQLQVFAGEQAQVGGRTGGGPELDGAVGSLVFQRGKLLTKIVVDTTLAGNAKAQTLDRLGGRAAGEQQCGQHTTGQQCRDPFAFHTFIHPFFRRRKPGSFLLSQGWKLAQQ